MSYYHADFNPGPEDPDWIQPVKSSPRQSVPESSSPVCTSNPFEALADSDEMDTEDIVETPVSSPTKKKQQQGAAPNTPDTPYTRNHQERIRIGGTKWVKKEMQKKMSNQSATGPD